MEDKLTFSEHFAAFTEHIASNPAGMVVLGVMGFIIASLFVLQFFRPTKVIRVEPHYPVDMDQLVENLTTLCDNVSTVTIDDGVIAAVNTTNERLTSLVEQLAREIISERVVGNSIEPGDEVIVQKLEGEEAIDALKMLKDILSKADTKAEEPDEVEEHSYTCGRD